MCQGQNVMYQQEDLTRITRNMHVKYQGSSTHCLFFSSKNKFQTVLQNSIMTERRNDKLTELQPAVNIYSSFYV